MTCGPEYDRKWVNSDGSTFYGIDDGEGNTDWYDSKGDLDCTTKTPSDDEQEANAWEHGYEFDNYNE